MAQGQVELRDRLHSFFLTDDQARWKAIVWVIVVCGGLGSIDLVMLSSTVDDAVAVMATVALIMSAFWIGGYCLKRDGRVMPTVQLFPRRTILQTCASGLGTAFALTLSRLQARQLSSELQSAIYKDDNVGAAQILDHATYARTHLDTNVTDQLRSMLMGIPNGSYAGAWEALSAYAKYRSFSVRESPAIGSQKLPRGARWGFEVPISIPHGLDKIKVSEYQASAPLFALFQPIASAELQDLKIGPAWVVVTEVDIAVDGWKLRSAICKNCLIIYAGGPVAIERTYFDGCRFQIAENEEGFKFAKSVFLQLIGPITYVSNT